MDTILANIEREYDINPNERQFLEAFIKNFMEKNREYLNIDLSNREVYEKYTKIKTGQTKILNHHKLENVEQTAHMVIEYLKEKKRIILITDSDLDGSCCRGIATSFDLFLKRKFGYTYIFEQYFSAGHTHGICFSQIDSLLKDEISSDALIITADNGINNREEILLIKEKYPNVKIIVTDHHLANEGEGVFDIVEHVLNPEAVSMNVKSQMTKVEFNGEEVKTSFSGAHTFYFLVKEILEQLKISDEALNKEILLIALFSDIGDIINFGPDVMDMFVENIQEMKEVFFIDNYKKKLDSFNQFPDDNFDFKVNEYMSKVITMLNSTRRTNSILLKYNELSKEEFSSWLLEKFGFDSSKDLIVLNKKQGEEVEIMKLMDELNKSAKKIYSYFYSGSENRYKVPENVQFAYSYIKEMVVFLLMSNDENKNKNDRYFLEEAYSIINKMNLLKNAFRNFIVDNELYITDKWNLFETYFSKKDGVLREILSIQAFIENDERKSFLTLAQNQEDVINGSMRSKSVDFKDLFNNNPKIQELKAKYSMEIDIFGHSAAAGIFFKKVGITYDTLKDFLDEVETVCLAEGMKLTESTETTLSPKIFQDIDAEKMLEIIKSKFIIGPNSFIKPFRIKITGSGLKEEFGERLKISTSKTGTKYMNIKDGGGNTFLFFPKEEVESFERLEFLSEVVFKFNSQSKKYYCEMMLNAI